MSSDRETMEHESGYGETAEREVPLHVLRRKGAINALSFDRVFELLANQRRRFVVHYLSAHNDEAVRLEDIVRRIESWEREVHEDVPDAHASRIRQSLHNVHLPLLVDANVVDYDLRSGYVRYWGHPVVEEYAEHVAAAEVPGREY